MLGDYLSSVNEVQWNISFSPAQPSKNALKKAQKDAEKAAKKAQRKAEKGDDVVSPELF